MGILAGTNFLGLLFTFFIPETTGKSLEDLNDRVDNSTEIVDAGDVELSTPKVDNGYEVVQSNETRGL